MSSKEAVAYTEKLTNLAEDLFKAWARGEVDKFQATINNLSPLEAATVMLMTYKGMNKFDQPQFSTFVGALAGSVASERAKDPKDTPFKIQSIDWNDYALYVSLGPHCYGMMTQIAASGEEARHFMAQRMASLVRAAPIA